MAVTDEPESIRHSPGNHLSSNLKTSDLFHVFLSQGPVDPFTTPDLFINSVCGSLICV